jgi:DNA invertase Pin-like site-specific DNA recombinase
MCEAMDKAEKRGKEIGQKIGELRGAVRAYYDMKLSEEAIAEKMSISVSEVEEIISSMGLAKQ